MIRTYQSGETKVADYFSGVEVENLPTKGKWTLFVAVEIDADTIASKVHLGAYQSVYLGANHFFVNFDSDTFKSNFDQISALRKEISIPIVIDIPISLYHMVLSFYKDLATDPMTIFNISIPTPKINTFSNVFFKLDDIGFKSTNPGVWVISPTQIESIGGFNDWSVYEGDNL